MPTAIERFLRKKSHKIVSSLPEGITWASPGSAMVVSTPQEVAALIIKIPRGKLTTSTEIRHYLAEQYNTDLTCPISTGIFINLAAKVCVEMEEQALKTLTNQLTRPPYWRVLKAGGFLNEKYPFGVEGQREKLEAEGLRVEPAGRKKLRVTDYQKFVFAFS